MRKDLAAVPAVLVPPLLESAGSKCADDAHDLRAASFQRMQQISLRGDPVVDHPGSSPPIALLTSGSPYTVSGDLPSLERPRRVHQVLELRPIRHASGRTAAMFIMPNVTRATAMAAMASFTRDGREGVRAEAADEDGVPACSSRWASTLSSSPPPTNPAGRAIADVGRPPSARASWGSSSWLSSDSE